MFKQHLRKSIAGSAVLGSILAASLVSGPAVTTANMACTVDYQNSVVTTTDLSLSKNIAQYGSTNVAHVDVSSNAGTPTGTVTVKLVGVGTWTRTLNGGVANVRLPRFLGAQSTYSVTASYAPGCSVYKRSSDSAHYTVVKAHTGVDATAANKVRGTRPIANATVSSATGLYPRGRVSFQLIKNGHVRQTRTATVSNGHARAVFAKVWKRGPWSINATYLGNKNFRASSDTAYFRVTFRR